MVQIHISTSVHIEPASHVHQVPQQLFLGHQSIDSATILSLPVPWRSGDLEMGRTMGRTQIGRLQFDELESYGIEDLDGPVFYDLPNMREIP